MPWHARLHLHYTHGSNGTGALDRHEGPLRVLQRLYPEGQDICHHVLVHAPGGIVGGDVLDLEAKLEAGSHALITTPGATRFYRSAGELSEQLVHARLDAGARLEWLPLETIAYSACQARNSLRFHLAPGAEMIGWDLLALGLPTSGQPFERGRYLHELELRGAWLERGRVDAADTRLLDSPVGWAGRRVLATMWFASGATLLPARRDALLDGARERVAQHTELAAHAGATAPHDRVVVLRMLAHRVEPAMQLLKDVWATWRGAAWQLDATPPRLWRT